MTETHIAGHAITLGGKHMRQRCEWCGKTLLDYDLTRVAVMITPGEPPSPPSQYPVGHLIRFDGGASYPLNPEDLGVDDLGNVVPPTDACIQLDPAVTK